ncbi:MAG: 3-hydroxybutyryl-CoA dehydrogenase [Ignavibacteriae bacterium HGW-Ignavibacteriae-2]|jgi:3-hydroxybutyryl-CoA dehydrogenase|nr:NAD(P)-binding domain-containing protein [Bacteroidota bacterium]PKL89937.1 MAG: 3-hydroxybutyryl-CoA dehydrogenase [Ignavibacteriae bacterium HGW-Ignavibacteriae-2]
MADEAKVTKLEDLLGDFARREDNDKIDQVAIIGAGVMGRGIAQTIASAGIEVVILEKSQDYLNASLEQLKKNMEIEIGRWAMTESEMKAILSRISWTLDFTMLKHADIIIEAVDESFQLKRMIFKKLDEIAKSDAIIISNTSTLSLTQIAEITHRKDKIIGVHFLNPVPKIPLVELVRALETSDDTVEKIKKFASRIGKTAVEVYEYPGFVTTRVIVPYLNEAMHILLEGVASAKDIDTAMKLGYSMNIGPLELADSMGLDEVLSWMIHLYRDLGEPRYRPCPILRKLVRDRKLGKKTGEGFFKYDENDKIIS